MNDYVRVRYPRYRVTLHGGRIAESKIINLKISSIITAIYISLFLSLIYSVYKISCNSIIMISKRQEECDSLSRRVVEARGGKKGTERRERCVNNLHSDESIVLRRAHATAPIIALRLAKASTELLHSHPLRARVLHQPPAPFWSLRPLPLPHPLSTHPLFFPYHSLALACSFFHEYREGSPFHSEKFNYNRNYHSKKVSLANARHLRIAMIPSFAYNCSYSL